MFVVSKTQMFRKIPPLEADTYLESADRVSDRIACIDQGSDEWRH